MVTINLCICIEIKIAEPALLVFESDDWNDMDNAGLVSPRVAQEQSILKYNYKHSNVNNKH